MACMFPGPPTCRRFWATSSPASTRSPRCPPSAGTRPCTTTPDGARANDPVEVGRVPARRPLRPAARTASRRGRWRASSRCSCSRSRSRGGRSPTPATRRGRSTARGPRSSSAPRPAPTCPTRYGFRACCRATSASCRPSSTSAAAAHRGLVPRRAGQRHRRAASPTGSTSAAPTTPSTPPARRRWPRVDVACKELARGASDLVLCGGADLHNGINDYLLFACVHALSPDRPVPHLRRRADGIALGEGVACVVLKRLADAERDGDRIYAVIKGVGGSSDGRSPRADRATARGPGARARARVRAAPASRPPQVGLVEAHGTGTVVGDRTELATLTEVFSEAGAAPGGCALGSVKSQIGHTKCAAGLAGLIKAALALHHGVLPPTLHVERPTRPGTPRRSPFVFHEAGAALDRAGRRAGRRRQRVRLRRHQLPRGAGGLRRRRRAGARRSTMARRAVPVPRRRRRRGARRRRRAARRGAASSRPARLRRPRARALRRRRGAGGAPVAVAVVATDARRAGRACCGGARPARPRATACSSRPRGRRARARSRSCSPARAASGPGMLADLFVAFPRAAAVLLAARATAGPTRCSRRPPSTREATARRSRPRSPTPGVAQPALGIAGLAVARPARAAGVAPDMVAGHSYGELVALGAAGALTRGRCSR